MNDLDNRCKPNFILLAAIWFSTNKPDADAFFKNFVEQGNRLSSEGLNGLLMALSTEAKFYLIFALAIQSQDVRLQG